MENYYAYKSSRCAREKKNLKVGKMYPSDMRSLLVTWQIRRRRKSYYYCCENIEGNTEHNERRKKWFELVQAFLFIFKYKERKGNFMSKGVASRHEMGVWWNGKYFLWLLLWYYVVLSFGIRALCSPLFQHSMKRLWGKNCFSSTL